MNTTTALSKSSLTVLDDLRTEKLRPFHRERLAVVYVRQSTWPDRDASMNCAKKSRKYKSASEKSCRSHRP